MPTGPSANALNLRIDWLRWSPTPQDVDAGAATGPASYTSIASDIPAGCHLIGATEVEGPDNRPSTQNTWAISMGQNIPLKLKDEGVFTLDGITHTIFVQAIINRSGRSKAYKVICGEKV